MTMDMKKMRKAHEREQRGGDFLTLDQGETLLYIHPPCRPDDQWPPTDGINYIPIVIHYELGKAKGMIASLDPDLNPIIEHPFVKRILKKKKVHLTGECPAKAMLESGDMDAAEMDRSRASTRYMWGVTPLGHRSDRSEEWRRLNPKPSVMLVGKTLLDGIMEVFYDNGDITDPNAAMLIIVNRIGKDLSTKYKVKADPETLKKPKKLAPEVRAAIAKSMIEEGDCDLFKVVANIIKGPAEVEALISGVKADSDPDEDIDDEDEDDEKPAKAKAKAKAKPATKKRPPADEDDEDEDDEAELDEDEDDEPPVKAKPKAKKPAADEDDEEESEADEDDEDDEPPVKAKAKGKPSKKPAADEDDEAELDDEDEEEEKPKPKAKGKPAPAKKRPPADDDDEDEAADEDDEDDEPPVKAKPKAKPAKKPSADEDEDEDLEDDDEPEDDEEEEKPKPKAKAKGKPSKELDEDLDELDAELKRISGKKAKK